MRKISPKQKIKQDNWNRLVAFLSGLTSHNGFYQTDCCNSISATPLNGAHIISKGRGGKWNAGNCLLVSNWCACDRCGCHDHHQYADGLRISIVAALAIARARNEKYGINPNFDGSKGMNPYLEVKAK